MKVLLYTENYKTISKSGLGKAIEHQKIALESQNIEYTTNIKDDFDIAHINTYFPRSYLYAKKFISEGKKIVYHAHSTEEDFRNSFLFSNLISGQFKRWITTCYNLGDIIITPTEYSKRLLETYDINKEIVAISNGIDLNMFSKIENARDIFIKKYNYDKDDKIIMGVGLYIERKGILDFVELAKRLKDYKFIWFGYTDLNLVPNKIKEAVETELDNLYFAGYVEQREIALAMQACDLYIFPTYEETEGIPVLEAAASYTPLLIRDIPVFDGWLKDGFNSYKAKDIDDFEEKIKKIINGEYPDLTLEARKLADERSIENIGKELKKVYEKVLEK